MMDFVRGPAKRPTIMVLEDDHGVRRSLQLLLHARGFDVRAYASATAMLLDPELADAACFISDFVLPELDGIAVLESLRKRGWEGPALLITAFGSHELVARALAAGFSEVLEKPFKDHALVNALTRLTIQHDAGDD